MVRLYNQEGTSPFLEPSHPRPGRSSITKLACASSKSFFEAAGGGSIAYNIVKNVILLKLVKGSYKDPK